MANSRYNNNINGLHTLAYMGVNASQPPQFLTYNRAPTVNDNQNVAIGDEWLDKSVNPPDVWKLVSLSNGIATWILITGNSGTVTELTGNDGLAATPLLGNINVKGDGTNITVTRSPDIHSLLITPGSNGTPASSFPTDSGTATPNATGQLNVFGGTGCSTTGAGNTVTVNVDASVPLIFHTDSGDATPAANALNVFGGTGISTAGAGSTITITATSAQDFNVIAIQTFTSNGTYTPTTNMKYCIVEMVGGGGGAGAANASGATTVSSSGGGGAGEYARGVFSAATIGASQSVTIGSGGAGGAVDGAAGSSGGTTSLGALLTAAGGGGAVHGAADTGSSVSGGLGGSGGVGGSLHVPGSNGYNGMAVYAAFPVGHGGNGGASFFGGGGRGLSGNAAGSIPGGAATNYGGGGGGGFCNDGATAAGGAGSAGLIVVTEFIGN